LPIIYDVAIKNNIRPERPMAASSIGAQMGIIASPVSVAVVSLVAMLGILPSTVSTSNFSTCWLLPFRLRCWGFWPSVFLAGSAVKT
jgi:anaerobic C4-dicarboxylate transporter